MVRMNAIQPEINLDKCQRYIKDETKTSHEKLISPCESDGIFR